jgi:type IV pilus assembly protein PilV
MVNSMRARKQQRGASMVEVLVTLVIIAFGLLGMAGLQMRLQVSETESYQRSQALLLLNDMANRIGTNRTAATAGSYTAASTVYGTGQTCAVAASTDTAVVRDLKEWNCALLGASESRTEGGVTTQTGAMIGGRGCIANVDGDIMVTVVWQGLTPIAAPPASVTCGAGQFNSGTCANDLCRRAVTTVIRIGTLI